jgi:hypothetical protein
VLSAVSYTVIVNCVEVTFWKSKGGKKETNHNIASRSWAHYVYNLLSVTKFTCVESIILYLLRPNRQLNKMFARDSYFYFTLQKES